MIRLQLGSSSVGEEANEHSADAEAAFWKFLQPASYHPPFLELLMRASHMPERRSIAWMMPTAAAFLQSSAATLYFVSQELPHPDHSRASACRNI